MTKTKPCLFNGSPFIYGTKEGLLALRKAINLALAGDVSIDGFARIDVHIAENTIDTQCVKLVDTPEELFEIVDES